MPPPRASVWNHYIKVDQAHFKAGRVACRYCGHHTSSWSVQRAQKHLRECRAAILANQVSTAPEAVGTPRGIAYSPGQIDSTTQSVNDYRESLTPTPTSRMSHYAALNEQQQILDQNMDFDGEDDQGWEPVRRPNENKRPQNHQVQQIGGIEQQQSQHPEHKQPQTQQSHTQTSQTEQPHTQQSTIQQIQAHPPHQLAGAQDQAQARINQHTLSDAEIQTLCAETIKARDRAYCPYSHFRVGATLLTNAGAFISGANVENAAYPSGTCAERCALGTAVGGLGLRRGDFRAVGVVTDLGRKTGGPASPCGMCRQALREFLDLSTPIFMFYGEGDGGCVVKTMEELLPMSFGPETLPPPNTMDQIQASS